MIRCTELYGLDVVQIEYNTDTWEEMNQVIWNIVNSGATYFSIRQDDYPVDPLVYLAENDKPRFNIPPHILEWHPQPKDYTIIAEYNGIFSVN